MQKICLEMFVGTTKFSFNLDIKYHLVLLQISKLGNNSFIEFIYLFLVSNKDSLISKERDTQVHREYTRVNKSKTNITKVK